MNQAIENKGKLSDDPAVVAIRNALKAAAESGDFENARAALVLAPAKAAKRAIILMGVPYLDEIRKLPQGKDFIEFALKPALAKKDVPPPPPAKAKKPQLLRTVSRWVLSGMLGLVLIGNTIHSQEPQAPLPAPVPAADTARMLPLVTITEQTLKDELARTTRGRELLAFMTQHNISLRYDSTMGTDYARYNSNTSVMSMSPALGLEEQLIYLAHEVRHGWQDKVLGYPQMEARHLTPEQRFALRRFMEADARAFSALFGAERRLELGGPEPSYGTAVPELVMLSKMRREFNSWNGLTNAEYRAIGFEYSLGVLGNYNATHFKIAQDAISNFGLRVLAADDPGNGTDYAQIRANLLALRIDFADAPGAAEFMTYLRRYGGMSMDPAAPTPLQSRYVTDATLMQDYPRRVRDDNARAGVVKEINATLDTLTQQYNGHRRRITELEILNDTAEMVAMGAFNKEAEKSSPVTIGKSQINRVKVAQQPVQRPQ